MVHWTLRKLIHIWVTANSGHSFGLSRWFPPCISKGWLDNPFHRDEHIQNHHQWSLKLTWSHTDASYCRAEPYGIGFIFFQMITPQKNGSSTALSGIGDINFIFPLNCYVIGIPNFQTRPYGDFGFWKWQAMDWLTPVLSFFQKTGYHKTHYLTLSLIMLTILYFMFESRIHMFQCLRVEPSHFWLKQMIRPSHFWFKVQPHIFGGFLPRSMVETHFVWWFL